MTETKGTDRIEVIRTPAQIAGDVERIAGALRESAGDRVPVFLGILKGSFVFLSDLVRAYGEPLQIDFLSVTRYDATHEDYHSVRVLHDLSTNVDGRLVIVAEGIRTSGTRLEYVDQFLRLHGAAEVLYCALLRQKGAARGAVPLDAWGFETDDEKYVVGYGLDLDERHRNLPHVGVIDRPPGTGPAG
ncbi:MAG: hypoxanthine phosphoribosyltransferase [Candidatus Eisenbacteria bacterium]|nr:hypoxanthine phosphoribosyltransferase [Candidatus Latescibacterota bacterium]MBD3301917.1 hypoxanthine phosphoribosyltransferase [Candidatus Eisenbacteria bacterium]